MTFLEWWCPTGTRVCYIGSTIGVLLMIGSTVWYVMKKAR
jgi:hypothetical protein